jgi:hypothetical protein
MWMGGRVVDQTKSYGLKVIHPPCAESSRPGLIMSAHPTSIFSTWAALLFCRRPLAFLARLP